MAVNQHTQTRPKNRGFLHQTLSAFPVALNHTRHLSAEVPHG